jgi:hypothetical protein
VTADLDARMAARIREARDARGRLRAVIRSCLALAEDNREFWAVFVEFWGEMMHDRELQQVNAALYRRFRRMLGALIGQGAREGTFRRVPAEDAGAVVLALLDGLSLQRAFDPRALTLDRATRACEDALLRYLGSGFDI